MSYNDIVVGIANIVIGGVIGTVFTSWYKDVKSKKEERKNLFLRMIAAKSYVLIPQMLINDMNMIEVLFRNQKKVLAKYRLYFDELCVDDNKLDYERQKALYWDLLREMGDHVGYKNLDNKTLNSRYIPNAAMNEHNYNQELRQKGLRFLTIADELYVLLIDQIKNKPQEPPKQE